MKIYWLNEDKLPSKLFVRFSSKIDKNIKEIFTYNQNNIDALRYWLDYIESILNYLSNPSIAFDYTNRYICFPNGTRFIRDFDYNIGYTIKTDNTTNQVYVYIFMINLKLNEFCLQIPPNLNESKRFIHLTESYIKHIVRKTLKRYLQ